MTPEKRPYSRLSAPEKRALARDKQREPAISCPYCETRTPVADLLGHIEVRCPGMPSPHPRSQWVTWRAAIDLGATRSGLHDWVERRLVRVSAERPRRYLMRDLVKMLAKKSSPPDHRQGSENRTSPNGRPKRRTKRWTKRRRKDRRRKMPTDKPLTTDVAERLAAFAKEQGGVEGASRRLDIPSRTLRAALAGNNLRRGTRLLIERQLEDQASSPR